MNKIIGSNTRSGTVASRPRPRSESFWRRLVHGVCRLRQRHDWEGFAGSDWVERIMATAVTDRFHAKQGRSTGRWILEAEGRNLAVYLKRHFQLPWWSGLLATLWPDGDWSPAMQEWRRLKWAETQGLPVPDAVAAGEFIGPWGRLQSFLAVEELTGMLPLHEAIPAAALHLDPEVFAAWKSCLIWELARLVRSMHERRFFHKDLYLCHFFLPEERMLDADSSGAQLGQSWQGRLHMIDLHRLAHHPWTWRIWQLKDLAQLLYSSEIEGLDARDRLRFWRVYLGPAQRKWPAKLLRRLVLWKWRQYRRHNEKHRSAMTVGG